MRGGQGNTSVLIGTVYGQVCLRTKVMISSDGAFFPGVELLVEGDLKLYLTCALKLYI